MLKEAAVVYLYIAVLSRNKKTKKSLYTPWWHLRGKEI
jgi:hypothetical protein